MDQLNIFNIIVPALVGLILIYQLQNAINNTYYVSFSYSKDVYKTKKDVMNTLDARGIDYRKDILDRGNCWVVAIKQTGT